MTLPNDKSAAPVVATLLVFPLIPRLWFLNQGWGYEIASLPGSRHYSADFMSSAEFFPTHPFCVQMGFTTNADIIPPGEGENRLAQPSRTIESAGHSWEASKGAGIASLAAAMA